VCGGKGSEVRKKKKKKRQTDRRLVRLGNRIREMRAQRGLTTISFARKLDLSQAQVSRLENGLQGFRTDVLFRMAKILRIKPSEMLSAANL
jgi:transcriptional regulator with XRE-family HTH domain